MTGISFKSQALYAVVFLTRYLDLFWSYISLYNTTMKIFFIASSIYTCYMMLKPLKATHEKEKVRIALSFLFFQLFFQFLVAFNCFFCIRLWQDTFKVEYMVPPVILMALIATYDYTIVEVGGHSFLFSSFFFGLRLEGLGAMGRSYQLRRLLGTL